MTRSLRVLLLATDLGFLGYWCVSALHLLPPEWLYRDAANPILQAWNLSFLPLDLVVSATGLAAVSVERRSAAAARTLAAVSLAFTSASGMNAIAFWALRADFDWGWWGANLFLLVWPWPFLVQAVRDALTEG